MYGKRKREIRVRLSEDDWFELKKLLADTRSSNWPEFFQKLLSKKREIIRVFEKLPP